MSPIVTTEVSERVAVISLNRPERHNAFTDELEADLDRAVAAAIDDDEVRAILLRGEGRSFSSGRDTASLGQRPEGVTDLAFIENFQASRLRMHTSPKPVVVACKGAVFGMGLEIALAADFRVASSDTRMGFPEVNFGIMTDTGGAPFAAALAGPSRAKYLVMTGEPIDAAQALVWGLVDFVVEPDELEQRASALARTLASKPPLAMRLAKNAIDGLFADLVRTGMRDEALSQCVLFESEDHRIAKQARRDKTTPDYVGR
ncbi:MAG TPA: enoyl-CoA hydratase/isomerase family protein [Pseudonocardia sp.]|jgi:enoyl-CoA hydratase/carnithine racemase|nr:enoyl-CoA hydratase/isomerase family protein [Pseudonocardia sp.]